MPCGNGNATRHVRIEPFLKWIYDTTQIVIADPTSSSPSLHFNKIFVNLLIALVFSCYVSA